MIAGGRMADSEGLHDLSYSVCSKAGQDHVTHSIPGSEKGDCKRIRPLLYVIRRSDLWINFIRLIRVYAYVLQVLYGIEQQMPKFMSERSSPHPNIGVRADRVENDSPSSFLPLTNRRFDSSAACAAFKWPSLGPNTAATLLIQDSRTRLARPVSRFHPSDLTVYLMDENTPIASSSCRSFNGPKRPEPPDTYILLASENQSWPPI